MRKILVLGANGFIGKAIVKELSGKNSIVAYGRTPQSDCGAQNYKYVNGNFKDENRFEELLDGVNVVIHLICSAVPSDDTSGIENEIEENVVPTIRLLEALKDRPEIRLIFASSAGTVYGETGEVVNTIASPTEPNCSYGVQKIVIEDYIKFYGRRYGLNYAIMRMSNPYGVGQNPEKVQGLIPILIRQILDHRPVSVYGDGRNLRDYIYLPELSEGIIRVIDYNGPCKMFNLGFGKYYSINEVISVVESVTGKKFVDRIEANERFCDVKKSIVDFRETQRILSWTPQIDLTRGIELTYGIMKAHINQEI